MSIVEYGDKDSKIEKEVTKFYAILLCCSDYPVKIDKYGDIDDILSADDSDVIDCYYPLAENKIYFDEDTITGTFNQGNITDLDLANELIDAQRKEIKRLGKENRDLKIDFAKCKYCKYADLFIPTYASHWIDPKCSLNVKPIHSDSNACEKFKMYGRKCR